MSGFRATGANAMGVNGNGFGSAPTTNPPVAQQSGFGSQPTGGFGSAQPTVGFGTPTAKQPQLTADGFGTSGFGSTPSAPPTSPAGGFGSAQPRNGFEASGFNVQTAPTNGFGSQAPNGFGSQPSGFGTQQSGFSSATTTEKPTAPKPDEQSGFATNQSAFNQQQSGSGGGFGTQTTGGSNGFGSAQLTGGFETPTAQQPQPTTNGFGSAAGGFGSPTKNTTTNVSVAPSQAGDATGHQKSTYVPQDREVDKIFEEDSCCKLLYDIAFENDDDVLVENGGSITKIDSWNDAPLNPQLMENIRRSGYTRPRKIQSYTIPYILDGQDLKGQAETGSGKSAAFLVPIIHMIAKQKAVDAAEGGVKNKPRCVIIEPTRELALQLYEQGRKLANDTGVQVVKSYGEYKWTANADEILHGCDIVIGTPGRLHHFMTEGIIGLQKLTFLVLDEADRLLDQNFKEVISSMKKISTFPKDEVVQTLLFSATFPKDVEQWANELLKSQFVVVKNKRSGMANQKITQEFRECRSNEKKDLIVQVLKEELVEAQKKDPDAEQPRTLIFVTTRRDADVMAVYLCESGFRAATINGDRTQDLREEALRSFRDNEVKVLVSTDVCARGLDIKDLDNVVNMDLPQDVTTYVHRIGRTGRLRNGRALSLFDPDSENDQKLAKPLVGMLKKDGNTVPDYIQEASENSGGASGFGSKSVGKESNNDFGGGGGFGGSGFGDGDEPKTGGFGGGGFGGSGF